MLYLHGDHLGSVSLATNQRQAVVSRQDFDPWGAIRSGDILQRYRYSNPTLSRFISAGSAGRGVPTGTMVGVALKPLTVDFHETGFVTGLNAEHGQGFWFQLSAQERQEVAPPWGPANPQGLNRYAYVQNNPLRYTDPTGHMAQVAGAAVGGFFVCGPACAIIAGGAVLIASAYVGAKIGEALAASQKDEPISGNVKRLPESEINPPTKRGNAPTSKKDGKPVELHHVNQDPNGPFEEMSRTDHRGKGNFKKNHSNTGKEKSRIDRDEWKAQQRRYWEKEYDRGRWNPK